MVITAGSPYVDLAVIVHSDRYRGWQPYNVTWVALNARSPAERSITYAVYSGSGYLCSKADLKSDAQIWAACTAIRSFGQTIGLCKWYRA